MLDKYDFLVIGGGPGGIAAAMEFARADKQVLLVEKGQGLGGACLFEGCMPSKVLRESARRLREIHEAVVFGLCLPTYDIHVDWSAIQERKQAISHLRSTNLMQQAQQYSPLDVTLGSATLIDAQHAHIAPYLENSQIIEFDQAIIATGSKPHRPQIHGIDDHCVINSRAMLDINHIPKNLAIIGAGPTGIELGQIFNSLGSEVTLLEKNTEILSFVDQELAEQLRHKMQKENVRIVTRCHIERISHTGSGVFVEYQDANDELLHLFADTVLLATGRRANTQGLGLENTAVDYGPQGIEVNDKLQTSERNLYAVGDVIGQPMFAHWATAQGLALARKLSGESASFPDKDTNSAVIFSEPELAMVGLTEAQAQTREIDYGVAKYDYAQDARAQITNRAMGLLKILYERDSHRILGIHALVEGAGEMMGEAALAVKSGVSLEEVAAAIDPHPTLTESFALAARAALAGDIEKSA